LNVCHFFGNNDFQDGEPLQLHSPDNGTKRVYFSSNNNMTLVLDHVIGADDGEFQCELQNRVGRLKRTFTLTVKHGNILKFTKHNLNYYMYCFNDNIIITLLQVKNLYYLHL
jgi:hypothetical protein